MNSKRALVFLIVILSALALPVGIFYYFNYHADATPIIVKIDKGAGPNTIASLLKEKGVIQSTDVFKLFAKVSGSLHHFKRGTYSFRKNRYFEILNKLKHGMTVRVKVTLPEGWNSFQIGQRLKSDGIIADAAVFKSAVRSGHWEGKLFPETYFFELDSDTRAVIDLMTREFNKNFSTLYASKPPEVHLNEIQTLTLASIIEREARVDAERPLISSVYQNRLKIGMALEADPTVQFAVSRGDYWPDPLTYKDLKFNSPYNTYRFRGLPPGPISNPGLKSLAAALNPAHTHYLYFVADGSGSHEFSTTYQEHQKKRFQIRRLLRQKKK